MNDLYWIGPALVSGLLAVRFGLPPLVGYLLAGFVLNVLGFVDHDRLVMVGELGVTLLLFTIGLKLEVRSLLRPVIWAGHPICAASTWQARTQSATSSRIPKLSASVSTVCISATQRSFTPRWTRTSSGRRAGRARGTTI